MTVIAIISWSIAGAIAGFFTYRCVAHAHGPNDGLIAVAAVAAALAGCGAVMSAASHHVGEDPALSQMDFHGKLLACAAIPSAFGGLFGELSTGAMGRLGPALVVAVPVLATLLLALIIRRKVAGNSKAAEAGKATSAAEPSVQAAMNSGCGEGADAICIDRGADDPRRGRGGG